MKSYLTSKAESLRQRLIELDREKLTVTAELRAYDDMLHRLEFEEIEQAQQAKEKPKGTPTEFEMSKDWLRVMQELCKRGKSFSAGDMVQVATENGFGTKTTNARSQLAFYRKKKYVRRIERGLYSITSEGKAVFQKKETPTGKPEGVSEFTGEAPASPIESRANPSQGLSG